METIINLLKENVGSISAFILGIGVVWAVLAKASAVMKEVYELLQAVVEALADKKIDNNEITKIMKEGKDIITVIKYLKNIK